MNKRIVYALLFVFAFVLYGNSIRNKYSLDDHLVNVKNDLTQHGIKGIPAIFSNFSFSENNINHQYRPVLLTSFAIEYSIFGTHPHTSHFINVLLYALLVVIVYRFSVLAFPELSMEVRMFAILLFLIHPLHSEMVNNIKSRDEILVGIFGFSALLQYLLYLNDKRQYRLILLFLCLLLGYLSKKSALMYFAVFPFLHMYHCKEKGKTSLVWMAKTILVLVLVYGCFMMLRGTLPDNEHFTRSMYFYENPFIGQGFLDRFLPAFGISLFNLKMLVWPFPLSYYYGYNTVSINSAGMIAGGIVAFAIFVFFIIRYYRRNYLVSLALTIIVINLGAVSNFFMLLPGIVGERFLLLGSFGICLLTSEGLVHIYKRAEWLNENKKMKFNWIAISLSAALIIVPATKVFQRNKIWYDEFKLISTDVEHLIRSVKAHDLYVNQIMQKIRTEKDPVKRKNYKRDALNHATICIYIDPGFVTGWNNLGLLYLSEGEFRKAEVCMRKALSLAEKKDASQYMLNLAVLFETKKDLNVATEYYHSALMRDPATPNLIPAYKQFVLKNGKVMEAILFLKGIMTEDNKQFDLYLLMTDLYMSINEPKLALFYVKKANEMQPSEKLASYIEKISTFIEDNSN